MYRQTTPTLGDLILNHPEVRPTMEYGDHHITCAPMLANPQNVLLADESLLLMFLYKGNGVYGAHVAMLPERRGKHGIQDTKDALDRLFREFGAKRVEVTLPVALRRVRFFARTVGFAPVGIWNGGVFETLVLEAK